MNEPAKAAASQDEIFALSSSRFFPQWLAQSGGSIAFTTYQASKLHFIGSKPDGKLSIFERTFSPSTECQVERFDYALPTGDATPDG